MKNNILIFFILSFLLIGNNLSAQTDSDGDGIINTIDLDDDNDGILDCAENRLNKPVNQFFELNENATQISSNEVQLTPALNFKAGQMWSYVKVDFTKNFSIPFEAYLGNKNNAGADGIAIVFQNDPYGINATGGKGGDISAKGIQNGVVLELDTYDNTGDGLLEPAADHGQIWKSLDQTAITSTVALPNLEDGAWHAVVVNWDSASQTLSYTVDGTLAGTYTGNIVTNYFGGANKVYFGFTASTGGLNNDQRVRFSSLCSLPLEVDTDNDGIPDHLDLDSDNDGCIDALEGGNNISTSQLVNAGGSLSVGTGSTASKQNLCAGSSCVDASGVPHIVGSNGQTVGDSQNAAIQSGCFCYKPAQTSGTILDTNHGITALGRAGEHDADGNLTNDWPMVRKGAWTVLEAKTKGFVINRLTNDQITAIPSADLREGMMVYNINQDCLQINIDGTATGWRCFNTQTCPDL